MLRRLRRPAALIAPLLLVVALSAACGDAKNVETGTLTGADAFTLSGDFGSAPTIDWKGRMKAGKADVEVPTTGDGAALVADDKVIVNYWVGNGYTEKTTLDTYDKDALPLVFPVGGQAPQPTSQDPTEEEVARYLLDSFVAGQVVAGDTLGTRKVVTVDSSNVVGFGGGGLDLGNADGLVFVIDIESVVLDGPDGTAQPRSPQLPTIDLAKKQPASLSFTKTPAPDGELHVHPLVEGKGADVEKDDLIVVNYLGQVYDGAKPFDESYSKSPFTTVIGQGAVVKGWDQGLVGVPVGSRVMLEIPPALGYGKDGQGDSIPGGSTLYFVIDVLAAG
ncbi:hypothetical protein BH11ACT8_BH11ACT8_14070 [soil metagenome]